MVKIVFFYTKGGTGKTTLCFNYGWYLAEKMNKRVLFMDFDPQMNLVKSFGDIPDRAYEMTIERMIIESLKKHPIKLSDYLVRVHPRIDLLACSNNISQIEEYLTDYLLERKGKDNRTYQALHRNILIKKLLDEQICGAHYDCVLIDSQPNYSLLSTTAILYAQRIVLVVRPELFSLLDMNYLFKIVETLEAKFGIRITLPGAFINGLEPSKPMSRKIAAEFERRYGERIPIIRPWLRSSPPFALSITMHRNPIFLSYPEAPATADALKAFAALDALIATEAGTTEAAPTT
jgi:chromosome partitioning protein